MSSENIVHVAVAVVQNQHGQYLVAKRHPDSHQGGLWEFPGGKVEGEETIQQALSRELQEEVGISCTSTTPLIQIQHDYGDKTVFLDVHRVHEFSGNAYGKEGQQIAWLSSSELHQYKFPQANNPILKAIQLPDKYLITGSFSDETDLLARIENALNNEIKLIQFRAHQLDEYEYFELAKKIFTLCQAADVKILLNTTSSAYKKYQAENFSDGLHLTSKEIKKFMQNEINTIVSTSVHNLDELQFAEKKNVDFVILSPVNITSSHPAVQPLGWNEFQRLTKEATMPVYALGGMNVTDIPCAVNRGGQGIAAIGAFWKGK